MKKPSNGSLNDFTPWQWELALVASRFRLGLLRDEEIIAFTHELMDEGYYDDVMLDIIDDDPLYPSGKIESFDELFFKLNFPVFTLPEAQYFSTINRIFSFAQRPFNINHFYSPPVLTNFLGYFYDLLGNDNKRYNYIDIQDFHDIIYRVDYAIDLFVDNINTKKETNEAIFDFLIECENWVIRNQAQIENILKKINTREEHDKL